MTSDLPLPPGFDELAVDDQIDYVQSLWDRIAANPDQIPVPEWHRRVIDQRIARHRANPSEARSWDEVREELQKKFPDRNQKR